MRLPAAFAATFVAVVLLSGCACPQAPVQGKVVKQMYTPCDLPRGSGQIVVRFAGHPQPATNWALVGNYGPMCWKRVTARTMDPFTKDADTYGLIFRMKEGGGGTPVEFAAPEDLLVTLIEEQRLNVWISYDEGFGKMWRPAVRRTWR